MVYQILMELVITTTKKVNLGITGTRYGMNKAQQKAFITTVSKLLEKYPTLNTFHQGCCIGVDTESARLMKNLYGFIVIDHPPTNKSLVGDFVGDQAREDKNYLARNRDIVNESQVMIAITNQMTMPEPPSGGTWYTLNYSIKNKKETYHIKPDGSVSVFNSL